MTPAPASVARARPYRVDEAHGRAAFDALRAEWNALLASGPADMPYARHEWIAAWLDAFAPGADVVGLVARDAAGRPVGMAPLVAERRLGVTRLAAPANDHSCRFEWVLGPDVAGAVGALWAHLRDRVGWDVLLLRDLSREGPTSTHLAALALADGHPQGRWESMHTPYVPLAGGPIEARLDAKLRANLRRRMRRLSEQGAVSYVRVDGGDGVDAFLDGFFALEAAGWKGERGTAIAGDPRLVAFYRGLARAAAAGGWLSLRALELDGVPVAMHFGLTYRGVYSLPKPAYDERLGACSPGQLLMREVFAECQARGLDELDFLGPDMPWKRDWDPRHRPHDWVYVYRPGLQGRAMHSLKHRVKPLAREVLAWWR